MNNQMDKILAGFAKWDLDDNRLKHLESDVWQRIAYERQEQPVGMLEGFLATICARMCLSEKNRLEIVLKCFKKTSQF